jgi:tetratricopeptide (TPR) repeat protein
VRIADNEERSPVKPHLVKERLRDTLTQATLLNRSDADLAPVPLTPTGSDLAAEHLAGLLSPDLQTQPELASTIYNAAGVAYLNRGHIALARKYIEKGLELRREFYGEEHPAVADSLQSRARLLRHDGKLKAAESDIRRALVIQRASGSDNNVAMVATLWELAIIQLENAELSGARRAALEGIDILEKLYLDRSDPHMPRLMDVVARVHLAHDEYSQAAEIYARVLGTVAEKQGDRHPKYATYLANLGSVEEARGNLAEAESCYQTAIEIYENINGKHPNLGGAYVSMGALQQSKGAEHFDSARLFYNKALTLSREIHGPDHAFVAYDESSLARLELECGNLDEARRLAEDALRIYRATQPASAYTASTLTLLARIAIENAQADGPSIEPTNALREAHNQLNQALTIYRKEFGERSLHFVFTRAVLGRARLLAGEARADAMALLRSCHAQLIESGGATHAATRLVAGWIDGLTA